MSKCIMVQGTMSGAGKSLLTAALCRIFVQDGYKVAPFKSQNMALNSYITEDGLEMGRAQVVQAYACGKEPDVRMNPILLKPSSDVGSQLIVDGKVYGDYRAKDYFKMKKSLIPNILAAYDSLTKENDIIVIEGAGSPAEINLKADDIVNMGMAKLVNAPVLLVGDIDRGGVFAQLYGTTELLEAEEKARIVGTVINKFRGDPAILEPGLKMLEEKTGIPVLGVIPYSYAQIDDEDSQASVLEEKQVHKQIDIAVIRLPHLSNFTDFTPLENHPALGVRYVSHVRELGNPDFLILPGSKNTMSDLLWLRSGGLEMRIRQLAAGGTPVMGICGGFQMMGKQISDPLRTEHGGEMAGIGLLPVTTVFEQEKIRTRVRGTVSGPFAGAEIDGYEIHMGRTVAAYGLDEQDGQGEQGSRKADPMAGEYAPFCKLEGGHTDGIISGHCFGTYLHGLFDSGKLTEKLAEYLLTRKGIDAPSVTVEDHRTFQDRQIDLLAGEVRKNIDLDAIYRAMEAYDQVD